MLVKVFKTNTARLDQSNIELLRFFLIIFLLMFHFTISIIKIVSVDQMILEKVFRWNFSVSAFAIISGYFGNHKLRSALKLISLIVVYLIFNYLFNVLILLMFFQSGNVENVIDSLLFKNDVLVGNWWFIFCLVFVFMFSPLIHKIIHSLNRDALVVVFAILLFVFGSSNSISNYFFSASGWVNFSNVFVLTILYGVGILFKEYFTRTKWSFLIMLCLFVVPMVVSTVCSFMLEADSGSGWWRSPINFLVSIGIFGTFLCIKINALFLQKICVYLGSLTTFIYLTQVLLINLFVKVLGKNLTGIDILSLFFIMLAISIIFSPLTNWAVGKFNSFLKGNLLNNKTTPNNV